MKLESLSKSEKSNPTTFKMFDDDILLEKYVFFFQFIVNLSNAEAEFRMYLSYSFINNDHLSNSLKA